MNLFKKTVDYKKLRHLAWVGTKKSLPATILCLSLFFMNMLIFGYKNAVIAVPLTLMFNRIKEFPPEKWHPYSMILINLALAVLTHFAAQNTYLCIILDFTVTYLMVFLLIDSDTSKAYYGYGFGLVLFQSFSTTTSELGLRLVAIICSSIIVILVLFVLYYMRHRNEHFIINRQILNPFKSIKAKTLYFISSVWTSIKSMVFMLRDHLFNPQSIDTDNFDFRKTRFAIRIALLVTFSFFIERVFNIPKGYWLPLNVFVMTLNFYEDSLVKIKQRVSGNIAGVFISAVLLHYLTGFVWHMVILSIATFLGYSVNNYLFRATYMTCYAIALSTLFMKQSEVFELRLAYVLLAAVIAIIGSRFIFTNRKRTGNEAER